jgi:hypothetical protein
MLSLMLVASTTALCPLLKHILSGFSNVALIGSKPPPHIHKERVAGLARPRQTSNTLFYSFLGRGGEEEKDFEKPCISFCQCLLVK